MSIVLLLFQLVLMVREQSQQNLDIMMGEISSVYMMDIFRMMETKNYLIFHLKILLSKITIVKKKYTTLFIIGTVFFCLTSNGIYC